MADKKKTVSKTSAPKRARKGAQEPAARDEITTDGDVRLDEAMTTEIETIADQPVTTHDDTVVVEYGRRADVDRYVTEATYALVSERAYQRHAARGYEDGHDIEDWLAAESETERD